MIHGIGVGVKYNTIVDGRRRELVQQHGDGTPVMVLKLSEFITEVRNSNKQDFDMWYQLYSGTPTIARKKRHVHT